MQQPYIQSRTTLLSTVFGTFLSIFRKITAEDVIQTAVLAAIGASVSFLVSVSLRFIFRRYFSKK